MGDSGELESWEYQGGTFTAVGSWLAVGGKKVAELENELIKNIGKENILIKLNGGAFDPSSGVISPNDIRGYYILEDIQSFSANVPVGYSINVYGNNEGLNNSFKNIKIWLQSVEIETTYKYVVLLVKKNDNSSIKDELDSLLSLSIHGNISTDIDAISKNIESIKSDLTETSEKIEDSNIVIDNEVKNKKSDFIFPVLEQTGYNINDGSIIYLNNRAIFYCENNNIESIIVNKDYLCFITGNYKGINNPSNTIKNWNKLCKIDTDYKWLFFVIKKDNESDISDVDLSNILEIHYKNSSANYSRVVNVFNNTGMTTDGSIIPTDIRALYYCSTYNISKIKCKDGFQCFLYYNNDGINKELTSNSSWEQEHDDINTNYNYVYVIIRNDEGSSLKDIDLNDVLLITYKGDIEKRIETIENTEVEPKSYWDGKIIAYFGTSVPAQGYPQIVGEKLNAKLYNKAIGASMMRIGMYNTDDELGDDLGLTGVYFTNALKSMSMTQEERKRLFLCWTTEQRKQWLIDNKGYSAEDVADVKGYVEYMGGAFQEDSTDPTTSWPTSKPTDIWAGDGETYKSLRKDSYSYCWDNSDNIEGDLSYSGKITEHIDGLLQPFLSGENKADLFIFDHFRNDATDSTKELYLTIPSKTDDRRYALGAFIYLCNQIYLNNPNAKIAMVGHFDNDDVKVQLGHVWEAQEKACNYFGFPLLKLWEKLGIRCSHSVTTTGYWDVNGVWHEDGYNGSNHKWADNSNGALGLNENPRQITINGVLTWVHDLTTRQIWCKDDIHPSGDLAKNYFAEAIASWLNDLRL